MSVSTSSYFSNSKVGVPQVASDVDIWAQDSSPRFALGHKIERQDGAVFRYAHFGAAISSAGLVLAASRTDNGTVIQQAVSLTSTTYAMPEEPIGIYPNNKGSRYLIVKDADATADLFAGGYVTVCSNQVAGGVTYRIKSNTTAGTPLSGYTRLQLYDKLQAHVGSNALVQIAGCKWSNLSTASISVAGNDTAGVLAGISIRSSGTTYPFGWVISKGIAAVFTTGNCGAGTQAWLSTDYAGAVCGPGSSTQGVKKYAPIVGTFIDNGNSSSFTLVDVKLE